jgi:nucleoid DNA-binding protein
MMEFKSPDLTAPRFRPKKKYILNKSFYDKFIEKNPKYKDISPKQIKNIVNNYNGKIWETIVENRDGIELPEQLGNIFIGSTKRQIGDNINFKKSIELGYKVQNQNFESDQYLAKIFYTNYKSKYKFRFRELWGFTGVRNFKRTIAKVYPKEYKKYLAIDSNTPVSKLFKKHIYLDTLKEDTIMKLETYDEFDFS